MIADGSASDKIGHEAWLPEVLCGQRQACAIVGRARSCVSYAIDHEFLSAAQVSFPRKIQYY